MLVYGFIVTTFVKLHNTAPAKPGPRNAPKLRTNLIVIPNSILGFLSTLGLLEQHQGLTMYMYTRAQAAERPSRAAITLAADSLTSIS